MHAYRYELRTRFLDEQGVARGIGPALRAIFVSQRNGDSEDRAVLECALARLLGYRAEIRLIQQA